MECMDMDSGGKEKIKMLFEAYYPNKECIAEWITNNYAENNDTPEWDMGLPKMLNDEGAGFFNLQYYTYKIETYERAIGSYSYTIEAYRQTVRKYEHEIKEYKNYIEKHDNWIGRLLHKDNIRRRKRDITFNRREVAWHNEEIKLYKNWIKTSEYEKKKHENRQKNCTGALSGMDIDKFITYFLTNPNEYWSERQQERQVEYKQFATADNL